MEDRGQQTPRPLWVRLAVPGGMKRSAALTQIGMSTLAAFGGVCVAIGYSSDTSAPGVFGFWISLALAVLGSIAVVLGWLALRWVDRNGTWV